jgi:FkbM family methyltransferase
MDALRAAISPAGALVPIEAVRRASWLPGRGALLRLANDRLRRRPRRFSVAETSVGRVVEGSTADLIERYLYVFGTWEPSLTTFLRSTLRPGDVFVDIGANVGYFTLLAARAVGPTGRVIALEAMPATAAKLEANVSANGLSQVEVLACAASDVDGELEIYSGPETNLGRSSTAPVHDGAPAGRVRCIVAADAVPAELWPRVRAIKIDVEGDELRVLRGLRPLLAALAPGASVVVEVAPERLAERGSSAAALLAEMAELGFAASTLSNDYQPSAYATAVVQAPVPLAGVPDEIADVVLTKVVTTTAGA